MITQIKIRGIGAIAASEALLLLEGLTSRYKTLEVNDSGIVTTIATLVGRIEGADVIAERLYGWGQKYSAESFGSLIEQVILVGRDGKQNIISNLSISEIEQVLEVKV